LKRKIGFVIHQIALRMDLQLSRQILSKQLRKIQSSEVQLVNMTTFSHFHLSHPALGIHLWASSPMEAQARLVPPKLSTN
jgi:hypothetical protein